jgi:hypothetical protein
MASAKTSSAQNPYRIPHRCGTSLCSALSLGAMSIHVEVNKSQEDCRGAGNVVWLKRQGMGGELSVPDLLAPPGQHEGMDAQ